LLMFLVLSSHVHARRRINWRQGNSLDYAPYINWEIL
jgi:hypothetical protein